MLQNPSKYNMNYISNFLAIQNAANANAPHPQSSIIGSQSNNSIETDCDLDETQLERLSASTGKSFTIASILGLKKKTAATNAESSNQKQKELNAMNLSIHNNQNFQLHNKAFNSIDTDNRLLHNRIPLAFAHHHLQTSQPPHFYPPPNNNNNNSNTTNHNGTSALQSLQQQFHTKNSQNFPSFHGKEHRKNEHRIKSKSSLKSKRVRTIFTPEQLERLEAEFERQQYMVGPERLYLAHTLQLTEAQVKVWFQNRRIKWRKHHIEMNQQRLAIIRQCHVETTNGEPSIGNYENPTNANISNSSPALTDFDSRTTVIEVSGAMDSSELSICTDSMDSSSNHEVDDL